jgi:hypothetical protein
MTIMRKADFARRCNVSRQRVDQWSKAGQIDGKALIGTGRAQRIDVDVALAQLKLRLDFDQRFGLKGLWTTLDAPATGPEDDGLAYVERHRGTAVDLADVERAIDEIWMSSDFAVQDALEPFPEALAAYRAARPRLAAIKDAVVKA